MTLREHSKTKSRVGIAILILAGLGLMLSLLVVGCSRPQDRVSQADLLQDEAQQSGTTGLVLPDNGELVQSQSISVDVLAALFPAAADDANNLYNFVGIFLEGTNLAIEHCMAEAGFDYVIPRNTAARTRFFDFPDLAHIAEHGFATPSQQYDNPLQNVPDGLGGQFLADLESCYSAYDDPVDQVLGAADPLREEWYQRLAAIDASQDITAQFRIWRQCLEDGGWIVDSHRSFFRDLETRYFGLLNSPDEADWQIARVEELEAARLYVSCMEPLEKVRQPMRDEARRKFLEDNAEEIRAIEELADRLIAETHQR